MPPVSFSLVVRQHPTEARETFSEQAGVATDADAQMVFQPELHTRHH